MAGRPQGGEYGTRLRTARVAAGIKQAALAAELGIVPVYLGQVEYGAKPPFDWAKTAAAAAFLAVPPEPLWVASAIDRGRFPGLVARAGDRARVALGVRLTERWTTLSLEQIRAIDRIITG